MEVFMISDLSSNVSLSSSQRPRDDDTPSPIVNLCIDGEIIAVKHSTLCLFKDPPFSDCSWLKKHSLITEDGTKVVQMAYSSCAILSIIHQLRLQSMMAIPTDELPSVEVNKVESEVVCHLQK